MQARSAAAEGCNLRSKKLKVRGFIGVPLLGRTQYWVRTE